MSSSFFYDFSALNKAFDITNGSDTVTIQSTKHVVESCVCDNCKSIMAARKAAAEKKEAWTCKYTYTPPAPPKHTHCGCCHHHCHH
ncbi:hypothetical protein GGF46_003652 [Coemansia sp. RSA 552]|nr:hypothetical protein GGF46_003652 [Coemansia sp. RSA 552]